MKQSKNILIPFIPVHIINLRFPYPDLWSLLSLATPIGTLLSHTLITIGIVHLLCSLPVRSVTTVIIDFRSYN